MAGSAGRREAFHSRFSLLGVEGTSSSRMLTFPMVSVVCAIGRHWSREQRAVPSIYMTSPRGRQNLT